MSSRWFPLQGFITLARALTCYLDSFLSPPSGDKLPACGLPFTSERMERKAVIKNQTD